MIPQLPLLPEPGIWLTHCKCVLVDSIPHSVNLGMSLTFCGYVLHLRTWGNNAHLTEYCEIKGEHWPRACIAVPTPVDVPLPLRTPEYGQMKCICGGLTHLALHSTINSF